MTRRRARSFPRGWGALALTATEVKQTMGAHERALREEAERRSDLVTYLAHDLKTPLTSVIGYLSLLDEVPEMPREQRCRYVGVTLDKAKRLERLINEFFDITRYNLSHIELEVEPVDLSYLLVQMADEFYPLLQAHGNTCALTVEGAPVSVESPGAELVIEADPGPLGARVQQHPQKCRRLQPRGHEDRGRGGARRAGRGALGAGCRYR